MPSPRLPPTAWLVLLVVLVLSAGGVVSKTRAQRDAARKQRTTARRSTTPKTTTQQQPTPEPSPEPLREADPADLAPIEYTDSHRIQLKQSVHEMFNHAWTGYKRNAFPADELRPLSCSKNDAFGGYALTVIDTLDTLVLLGQVDEFAEMVAWLIKNIDFKKLNRKVSVFETNIRVLGGLVSAHVLAQQLLPPWQYSGELLAMSRQIADKLLPAFDTPTGAPYNEINLAFGVDHKHGHTTCPAAAGTLLMEFGYLGALTGDCRYVEASYRAMDAVWKFRTQRNLVGTLLDIYNGKWVQTDADIGASHDSFFEYMLKSYILFNDKKWLDMWKVAHHSAKKHLQMAGNWFTKVHSETGTRLDPAVNSLQAFWPGLLVLYGDVQGAILAFRPFECLFLSLGMLPEEYRLNSGQCSAAGYPLRPEMIESMWLLYRATKDPHYLELGEMVVQAINGTARTPCGFAAVKDVRTKVLEDKMDSYFLSETLKYLYLLFDPNPSPYVDLDAVGGFVLTTEAHPLPIQADIAAGYRACMPLKGCGASDTSRECADQLRYGRKTSEFFSAAYQRHRPAAYEAPVLADWEMEDLCPRLPHYMRMAGGIKHEGRCFPHQYQHRWGPTERAGVVKKRREALKRRPGDPLGRTAPQQPGDGGRGTLGQIKSVDITLSHWGQSVKGETKLTVRAPSDFDIRVSSFAAGTVLSGVSVASFSGAASKSVQVAVGSLPDDDQAARHAAHGIALCSLLLASEWAEAAADLKAGALAVGLRADNPSVPAAQLTERACRQAAVDAPEIVSLLQARWLGLFTHTPPDYVADVMRRRVYSVAKHSYCRTAVLNILAEKGRAPPSDKFAAEVLAEQLKVLNDTIAPADLPYASFAWTDASSVNEDNWKDSQHERFACPDEEPPAIQPDVLFRGNVATFGGKLVDALTQQEAPASGPAAIPPKENRQGCQAHHLRDGELRYADSILVVYRGSCSFHTKAAHAQRAGAAALVIISDRQTAPEMMTDQPGEQSITIPLVLLARADGTELFRRIASAAAGPALQLLLSPQTAGLPLEAHFLGIRAADSPYGLVLWRHERPVPAFLPRDKLHAALAEQVLVPDFSSAAPDHEEATAAADLRSEPGKLVSANVEATFTMQQAIDHMLGDSTITAFSCEAGSAAEAAVRCRFTTAAYYDLADSATWVTYSRATGLAEELDGLTEDLDRQVPSGERSAGPGGGAQLQFPREGSSVLFRRVDVSPGAPKECLELCVQGVKASEGWQFVHILKPLAGDHWWALIAWESAFHAASVLNSQATPLRDKGCQDTPTALAVVERLFHQPIAYEGSGVVLTWIALKSTASANSLYDTLDSLHASIDNLPGYLSREILSVPEFQFDGASYSWVDVYQFENPAQALRAEQAVQASAPWAALLELAERVLPLGAHMMSHGTHSQVRMPQMPVVAQCQATWEC